jgi:hypothetical protein
VKRGPILRPNGKVPCRGPHTEPAYRPVGDLLCRTCWTQLPQATRDRLKLSGGSGRLQPVVRYEQLRDQLAAGVPLNRIEVSP